VAVHGCGPRKRAVGAGDVRSGPWHLCRLPAAAALDLPDLREINIGSSTVEIRFEAQGQNLLRVVHLDQTSHPKDVAPSLLGHSIGRWERNTLVIDTIAFTPHEAGVWIRVPSGPGKHLVEKLSLAEDRRHLRYDVTLEDPAGLAAPAQLSSVWDYRPDLAPSGVPCDPAAARKVLQP
jgi:hypothetical protein